MKFVNVKNLSLTLVVGSAFLFAACGKKNNDKKADADTPKISQPYQKYTKILANAQGGTDGVKVSCSGTETFSTTTGNLTSDTFAMNGVYTSGNVHFTSITQKDEDHKDQVTDLNTMGISFECTAYKMFKLMSQADDWTFELTSCKDESGKTYKISNATPVSGLDLWCAGK